MTVCETPITVKQFRRTPWKFQQTFHTPRNAPKALQIFAATIVSANRLFQTASLAIDHAAFTPKNLLGVLAKHSIPEQYEQGLTLMASGNEETERLLYAALSDWLDFLFIPLPKPFTMFADHDEFATFFANTRSNLNLVVKPLSDQGFATVEYKRW